MRAVWSFWSKPFQLYKGNIWLRPLHHLLAWGLSLRAARRHYPDTVLITDYAGKKLLVDQLGLSFGDVSTELERLRDIDVGWWALGKLVAYSVQDEPFVHIDSDVFLWKPLPVDVCQAPVFAQVPETFHSMDERFNPGDIEHVFAEHGLALPIEWQWYRSREKHYYREECCGILGGSNLDFLRYYSITAIDLVTRPQNASAWSRFPEKECFNMIVEQFFLAACLDFHRFHTDSPFRGLGIRYLFSSWEQLFDPYCVGRLGFTHLMGGAKSHPEVARRLEERVRREDPAYFRRCEKLLANVA
jgi:hypothetical protein